MANGSSPTETPPSIPRRTTNGFTMPDTTPTNPLETIPTQAHQLPHNNIPNTPLSVATVSAALGIVFALGASLFVSGGVAGSWWATYQLGFFMAIWSFFHWAEFAVTAGWNREKLSVDSFLLDNGMTYHIAHAAALIEFFVTKFFWPHSKSTPPSPSQTIRSLAMIHAASNFSHTVATYKLVTHRLVTDGIYSISRHPSYTGFFYWGLGTQMVLQNPITFALYLVLLWRFFSTRIKGKHRNAWHNLDHPDHSF
ncbi:isoprenylcysteine carboxyl methyltransferase [Rhizoctonia solani]|uniref:Protein-S-isoprenylcysteine O-methyltransferase n=1 Tax=Rhizoctonia solani TaxID=456999 RepID=A0A8H8NPH6_9AGAM|nr:isoprenylcysteine carboxyl methyltransferase [Rhizoctonia solani]QRW16417.1 isoprenylcysteine carboxyl methyltransferase [Rhizoctonia solani]